MSKIKGRSYGWVKSYFLDHFPQVKRVEVEAKEEGAEDYRVLIQVKAANRWFVVSKSGHGLGEALGRAKKAMAVKIRHSMKKVQSKKADRDFLQDSALVS